MKQRYHMFSRLTWLFVLYAVRVYVYAYERRDSHVQPFDFHITYDYISSMMGVSRSTARRILQAAHDAQWGRWASHPDTRSREKIFVMNVDFVRGQLDSAIFRELEEMTTIVYEREIRHADTIYRALHRQYMDHWERALHRAETRLACIEWFARDFGIVLRAGLADDSYLTYPDA